MSGLVLALDPGLIHPAIAIGLDDRVIHASRVKVPGKYTEIEDYGERVDAITRLILNHAVEVAGTLSFDAVVYERPQIYRGAKSKGDPNDLIPLAMMGGSVAGAIGRYRSMTDGVLRTTSLIVRAPTPALWIGQIPKATKGKAWPSQRGQYIRRRMTQVEIDAVVESHDAVDAAGILMWYQRDAFGESRMARKRVLPGAT